MKKLITSSLASIILLASCQQSKYATTGSGTYETDEVYYQPSDTYISDFALVDDEAQMKEGDVATSSVPAEEDYYSGDSTQNSERVTNNYYGNVYQSPWGCGYGSGYGNYNYGSYGYWSGPQYNIGWNPWSGWYTSFNFGYNWGYSPWYCPYSALGYGWYSPYYNPWYYNQWGYNTWYSPYNYYNPYYGYNNPYYNGYWGGGFWAGDDDFNDVVFGHRNPIATGTIENSTYGDDIFYSGRELKPGHGDQPILAVSPALVKPAVLQHSRPLADTKPGQSVNQQYTHPANTLKPAMAAEDVIAEEDYVNKPSASQNNQPQTVIHPQSQAQSQSVKPRPTYATPAALPEVQSNTTGPTSQPGRDNNSYERPFGGNSGTGNNNRPQYNEPARQQQPTFKMPPASMPDRPAARPAEQPKPQPQRTPDVKPERSPSRDNGSFKMPSAGGNSGGKSGGKSGGSIGGGNGGGGGTITGPRRK